MSSGGHGLGMSSPVLLASEVAVTTLPHVPWQEELQESLAPGCR